MKFPIETTIDPLTITISLFLGLVLPQLTNIGPIRTAVATSLRDALDIQRKKKPDDFTVQMTKLENLGVSPVQTVLGLCFSFFGFLVYYFMPLSMFYHIPLLFFFILMCILFAMIIGMIFLAQLLIPSLEKAFIKMITYIKKGDAPINRIILKNMEAHRKRNDKTAMMMMVAVTFLIACGSGFAQFEYIVMALSKAVINGDVSLFIANTALGARPVTINEAAIRQFAANNSNIVTGLTFMGWTLNEIISGPTDSDSDLFIGIGSRSSSFLPVSVRTLSRDHLKISGTEYFYPEDVYTQYGKDLLNRTYR